MSSEALVWQRMARHSWPRDTEEQTIDYVYHGRMRDLPKPPSKTVRIFLSSTFTDMVVERNTLMKNVFPQLRQYCRDTHDLEFQVVDMRWGVRTEASVDHSARALCMREITNCGNLSIGPTFVTLLSERYGTRLLPGKIPQTEMDILTTEVMKMFPEKLELVQQWYQLDTNAMPPEYILKPLVKYEDLQMFLQEDSKQNINPKGETDADKNPHYKALLKEGALEFQKAEQELFHLLREAALNCLKIGKLTKEQTAIFFMSVTEEEIMEGIAKNEHRQNQCLAFVRRLKNISMTHNKAWRFIDVNDGKVESGAQALMVKLRDEVIPQLLPETNIYRYEVEWSDNEGVNEVEHAKYLQKFCEEFKAAIIQQIDYGVAKTQFNNNKLFLEILAHSRQCLNKIQRFHSRGEVLENIRSYIVSQSNQPLVVWGESGCGKTSLMAKAAEMVPDWLGDSKDLIVALRLLGTTSDSTSIQKVLVSVAEQLIQVCNLYTEFPQLPEEFVHLQETFKEILSSVPHEIRVVIFLDSLDQLSNLNRAHETTWLPMTLPVNVKLIVSTLPSQHDIFTTLKRKLKEEESYVQVPNLRSEVCRDIFSIWMKNAKRNLSTNQQQVVNYLTREDATPLYLKLLFDEIKEWKSYENRHFNCDSIESCILHLLRKIEVNHGQLLVAKSLGYLSASSQGLTELEMEDILSLDEEVLTDVYEFHIPPVRRLPSILWARIRHDLDEYIVDREADGTKVMAWYHRQFKEQSKKRYLGMSIDSESKVSMKYLLLFKNLRDYFAGTWAGSKPKPFTYSDWQCEKLGRRNPSSEEIRYVSAQPTIFKTQHGTVDLLNPRFNLRKISELPKSCSAIMQHEDITQFIAKHVGLNAEFLLSWIKNKPWKEISNFLTKFSQENEFGDDFRKKMKLFMKPKRSLAINETALIKMARKGLNSTAGLSMQMFTVHECLVLAYVSALSNPTYLGVDITGRLLAYKGIYDGIDSLIDYCDNEGRQLCALVPPHLQLETPGSELRLVANNHNEAVLEALFSPFNDNLLFTFSSKLVCLSMAMGQVLIDTRPRSIPLGDFFHQAVCTEEKVIASLKNHPWIYIFSNVGDILKVLKCEDILKTKLEMLKLNHCLRITGMRLIDPESNMIVFHDSSLPHIMLLNTDDYSIEMCSFEGRGNITAVAVDSGLKHLYVYDDRSDICMLDIGNQCLDVLCEVGGVIKTHHIYSHCDLGYELVLCSLSNGTIVLNCVLEKGREIRQGMLDIKNKQGLPKYGTSHYVRFAKQDGRSPWTSEYAFGMACTNSHMLVFCPHYKFATSEIRSEDDITENTNKDLVGKSQKEIQLGLTRSNMKVAFRVKRRYSMVEFALGTSLIIAARDGTIDLFKVNTPEADDIEMNLTGSFFTAVYAHGQDITKILTTEEEYYILFMTAASDGKLKFWMITRAGVTRKYIPNFDRAESQINTIVPTEQSAFTAGYNTRYINEWSLEHGNIVRTYSHPSKSKGFVCYNYDAKTARLYAVDETGCLFVWDTTGAIKDQISTEPKRNAIHSKDDDTKCAVIHNYLLNTHKLGLNVAQSRPHILHTVCNGLFLEGEDGCNYHIIFNNTIEVKNVNRSKLEYMKSWKMSEQQIIVLSRKRETQAYYCYIYDVIRQNLCSTTRIKCNEGEKVDFSSGTKEIIIASANQLTFWNLLSNKTRILDVPDVLSPSLVLSNNGVGLVYCKTTGIYYSFTSNNDTLIREIKQQLSNSNISDLTCLTLTSDGKYIAYVMSRTILHLVRYSDNKLLALYTMAENVCSLNVSTNNWFVILGTSDKRLFSLIIADPAERDHDSRIQYVREKNPGLSIKDAVAFMVEVNSFGDLDDDSDDSEERFLMTAVERRLEDTQRQNPNFIMCQQSENESSGSEQDTDDNEDHTYSDDVPDQLLLSLEPTLHGGEIFTPTPCNLQ